MIETARLITFEYLSEAIKTKTIGDISLECDVDPKTIRNYLRRYNLSANIFASEYETLDEQIRMLTIEATRIENHLQRIVFQTELLKIKRDLADTEDMRRIADLARKCGRRNKRKC